MGGFKKKPKRPITDPTPDLEPPVFNNPKGTGKPRRTAEDKAIINTRIEQCRALLRLSMSRGDIKRSLSKAWGVRPRSVERYLCVARARNLDFLDVSESELLADSLNWWASKKQEAERSAKKAKDRIDYAEAEIAAADETLNEGIMVSDEVLKEANKRKSLALRILEDARRMLWAAEDKLITYQTKIDDLTGVRPAPRDKDSSNSNNGHNLPPYEESDPVSSDQMRRDVEQLLESIEKRKQEDMAK